jgi:hypothetical protein
MTPLINTLRHYTRGGLPEPLIENYHARSSVRHTGDVRFPGQPLQAASPFTANYSFLRARLYRPLDETAALMT